MRLAQTILFVADVPRMQAFYGGLLGLPLLDASPSFVRLDAGGSALALHAIPPGIAGPIATPPVARDDTVLKLAFHVDDLDAARRSLRDAGVIMREPRRFGDVAFCDGLDPEGNVFQITTR
ncbi:MAG TPA: VOC family protein [Kofleriaceae bacterium]|nr:VOC family protein [Kofleriaceae bacterium]